MNELFIMLMPLLFGIAIIRVAYVIGTVDGERKARKCSGNTMDVR